MLYPLYLLGTLSAAIPIIIHMIHKRKAQKVLFPTIRFLKASNERTSRRQKIQDLLLLLLRVALLVLLALALAEPFLGSRRLGFAQQVHAVVLLDNSYSMGTLHERTARFDVAKQLATAAVDNLPEGSQATLMLSSPPFGYPNPLLSGDREALRRGILNAPLSEAHADMTAAADRAAKLLATDPAATLEIYAVTDLQNADWPDPGTADEGKRKDQVSPSLVVIDCGRDDYRNLAVDELAVRGGARVRGQPVSIQAKIKNYSPTPVDVNVKLYVDRAERANQQLQIPGNLTAPASFNYVFADAGIHTGWVQIDDDSLAVDNRRDFSIEIQEHIPVLLFREAQGSIPLLDPAFFISRALDPYSDTPGDTRSRVQTTVLDYGQITHEELAKHKVVALVDPGGFTRTQINVLRSYVRRGGRLMIFLGPNLRTTDMNLFLGGETPEDALMPLTVGEPAQGLIDRTHFKSLLLLDKEHPALTIFQGLRLHQSVKVYDFAPVAVDNKMPTRTPIGMIAAGDAETQPFLLENAFGSGRVVLFTTTTDPDWSNLAASPFFVPLLHRIVYYLTEREEVEGTHIVGSSVSITLRQAQGPVDLQVRNPDGEIIPAKAEPSGGVVRAVFAQTDKRGPYVYLVLDPTAEAEKAPAEARTQAESAFVVNLDSQESDLTKVARGALLERLKGRDVYFASSAEDLASTIERMRRGVPLRNFLLYIVLFIAIFETFFANRVIPALQRAEESRSAPASPPAAPAEA